MRAWTWEKLKEAAGEYVVEGDPSDPKEQTRRRILTAATHLFADRGFRRTSVEDVAQRAGLAKGTVYLYFKSKADLLTHAIARAKMAFSAELEQLLTAEMPATERLVEWIRMALRIGTEIPLLARLLSGDREMEAALGEMDPETLERHQQLGVVFLAELIDEAAEPHRWTREELEDRATVLMGFRYFSGLLLNETIRGGLSVNRYAGIVADMLVNGVRAPEVAAPNTGSAGDET